MHISWPSEFTQPRRKSVNDLLLIGEQVIAVSTK